MFTLPVIHQWRCLSHVILMLLDRNVSNYWHSWWPHNWTKPVTSGSCANTRAVACAHSVTIFNQIQIFVLVPLWGWLLVIIHFIQILVFPGIWKKIFINWCINWPVQPFLSFSLSLEKWVYKYLTCSQKCNIIHKLKVIVDENYLNKSIFTQ